MSIMDWSRVFSLLAHELRSPSAVIGGYARMLSGGRLNEDDRLQAYAQMERAAGRIASIGHQAADLARWLNPATDGASPIALHALVTQALSKSAAPERVKTDDSIEQSALKVSALDRGALTNAVAAAIDAVCREVTEEDVRMVARVDSGAGACDILVGPAEALTDLHDHAPRDGSTVTQVSAEREGLGLALIVSAVVLLAHGGQLSTVGGRRDVIALRLRTEAEVV
jgi:signal transduction histidine kinase